MCNICTYHSCLKGCSTLNNYPPYDPNNPYSQPTTAGPYPQFPPQWGQQPPPPYQQPGQFGAPLQQQKPPKPPLFDFKARQAYYKQYPLSKRQNFAIGCGTLIGVLFLCGICSAIGSTGNTTQKTANANIVSSPIQTTPNEPTETPTSTSTPTPIPTSEPTPTPTQEPVQSQPVAQQPVQSAPPPATTGVYGNPWGYDFNPGSKIYAPNADFCNGVYFSCVTTFWSKTNGYVVECGNNLYSHSGGVSGACSRDSGIKATLYQHP